MFESWIKILDPDQQKINVDPQPCFLEIIFSQKSLFACRADPDGWSLCDAGHPGGAQHHDAAVHQEVEHGYPPGHHPHLGYTQPQYRRNTEKPYRMGHAALVVMNIGELRPLLCLTLPDHMQDIYIYRTHLYV